MTGRRRDARRAVAPVRERGAWTDRAVVSALLAGLPAPVPEYQFAAHRRWRFDLAWPAQRVALELEGGAWVRGRHVRGAGYERDCEKYSHAAAAGWRVLRATYGMLRRDLDGWRALVLRALARDA